MGATKFSWRRRRSRCCSISRTAWRRLLLSTRSTSRSSDTVLLVRETNATNAPLGWIRLGSNPVGVTCFGVPNLTGSQYVSCRMVGVRQNKDLNSSKQNKGKKTPPTHSYIPKPTTLYSKLKRPHTNESLSPNIPEQPYIRT